MKVARATETERKFRMQMVSELFKDLEDMDMIKNHHGHTKGDIKLPTCSRCSYEEFKRGILMDVANNGEV
jgi:hypothetical protein